MGSSSRNFVERGRQVRGALGCLIFVIVLLLCAGATMWVLAASHSPEAAIATLVFLAVFVTIPVGMATGALDDY